MTAFVYATLGQKGGGGKSTIARALAAELTQKKDSVVVVDLDVSQRTTEEWNEARRVNEIKPEIEVLGVDAEAEPDFRLPELRQRAKFVIVDAPGWSDYATVELGERADLCILPTSPSTDDLRPTIRLYHELVDSGVPPERIVIVLNRVMTQAESKWAREYLNAAGLKALNAELRDMPIYRKAQNSGLAASEVSTEGPRKEALTLVLEIVKHTKALEKRPRKIDLPKPERFVLNEGEEW